MRITKKLRSDLEIIDSLQRITGYKNNKNSHEKSPRTILLQKISPNDNNAPIKVQLLKTKNSNYNTNIFNINSNSNSNSVSFNKRKVPFPKNENNYYFNKYDKYEINMQDNNNSRDSIRRLKDLLITNNKNDKNRVISYSPSSNNNFRNANYQYINQSPIKKTSENNLKNNGNDVQSLKEHKIRNVLSKNLTYNKKTPNSTKTSPLVSMGSGQQKGVYLARLKNSSDSNNNCIINMDYGSKTYVGRDNYSVSSFQNKNTNSRKLQVI